jgi:hypothetical protein
LSPHLPARLFEGDVSFRDPAFDYFTHAQRYVCKNAALLSVEAACDGEHFAPDDCPRADYQIIVGRNDDRRGGRGLCRAQQTNHQRQQSHAGPVEDVAHTASGKGAKLSELIYELKLNQMSYPAACSRVLHLTGNEIANSIRTGG